MRHPLRTQSMRWSSLVLLGLAVTATARADVAPYGWRPPPPADAAHAAALRASLEEWMEPAERERLDAVRVPPCGRVAFRTGRGAAYGNASCPDFERVRDVLVDRAVRYFAAEVLDAMGRPDDASALRALPPVRDAEARARAVARLASSDALGSARALAENGAEWSLEQLASELGRVIRAALGAGVRRDRLVIAAVEMMGELARPMASARARAVVEGTPEERRFAQLVAGRAARCLEPEVEARWRPVAVRVAFGGMERLQVVVSAPSSLVPCLEGAVREAATGSPTPPPPRPILARIIAGPRGSLWGPALEL